MESKNKSVVMIKSTVPWFRQSDLPVDGSRSLEVVLCLGAIQWGLYFVVALSLKYSGRTF